MGLDVVLVQKATLKFILRSARLMAAPNSIKANERKSLDLIGAQRQPML